MPVLMGLLVERKKTRKTEIPCHFWGSFCDCIGGPGSRCRQCRLVGTPPGGDARRGSPSATPPFCCSSGILEAEVAFLLKPFNPVALAQRVREVLDQ